MRRWKPLCGTLSDVREQVLNDVLDFNRMDSGRFESVNRPYTFHQVMRGMFVPLRLAADARGLDFITDLDVRIDRVGFSPTSLGPCAVGAKMPASSSNTLPERIMLTRDV